MIEALTSRIVLSPVKMPPEVTAAPEALVLATTVLFVEIWARTPLTELIRSEAALVIWRVVLRDRNPHGRRRRPRTPSAKRQ